MGNCCTSDHDSTRNNNNKWEPRIGRANSSSSPNRAYRPQATASRPEPTFTGDAQEVFDKISTTRTTKLRDRQLSLNTINDLIDVEIKQDMDKLRSLAPEDSDNQILLARSLNALGSTISTDRIARYDDGLGLQKEALEIYKKYYSGEQDHEALATSLHRVGTTILNHSKSSESFDEAVEYLQKALDMRRRMFETGQSDNAELCASLNSLGIALEWVNRNDEGAKLQREALDLYLKLHPEKKSRDDVCDLLNAFSGVISPKKRVSNMTADMLLGGPPVINNNDGKIKEIETTRKSSHDSTNNNNGDNTSTAAGSTNNHNTHTDESTSWL